MSKKTIKVNVLSVASIDRAIKEINGYKTRFLEKVEQLIKELVARGVIEAVSQITALAAVDTGELAESIGGDYDSGAKTGKIFSDCYYAVFVEYGTGVVGEANPHPANPWAYDVNGHGEDGWYYIGRDNHVHWTMGQPSRPFMYYTRETLKREAPDYYNRIFGSI